MCDTLEPGQWILYQRITSKLHYDDVVIFKHGKAKVIKRLVGVAGDTVVIREGYIYRNGDVLSCAYRKGTSDDMDEITVGVGEIFVLGDNLTDSIDSRSYGCIKISCLVGKKI